MGQEVEEEHGSSCADLSCAQTHTLSPSLAGGLDFDALEKVAHAADVQNPRNAHARPWAQHGHVVSRANPSNEHIAVATTGAAAEHIATFDPPTVLRLIAAARSDRDGEAARPVKMLVDAEWLSRKVEADPDLDAEAASPAPPQTGEGR